MSNAWLVLGCAIAAYLILEITRPSQNSTKSWGFHTRMGNCTFQPTQIQPSENDIREAWLWLGSLHQTNSKLLCIGGPIFCLPFNLLSFKYEQTTLMLFNSSLILDTSSSLDEREENSPFCPNQAPVVLDRFQTVIIRNRHGHEMKFENDMAYCLQYMMDLITNGIDQWCSDQLTLHSSFSPVTIQLSLVIVRIFDCESIVCETLEHQSANSMKSDGDASLVATEQ